MRLIDADAMIADLLTVDPQYETMIQWCCRVVDAQPTIEERKKGEWTRDNACPFCGFQPWYERDIHTLSFCPNCGADMRGEQDG